MANVREPTAQWSRAQLTHGSNRLSRSRNRRFIAWDGEGFTRPSDNRHVYALFGNSDGLRIIGDDLNWEHLFPSIMESDSNAIHVIFAGTYDLVMMVRCLSRNTVARILKGVPTYVGAYRVHYLRNKSLRISSRKSRQTRTIYDVFTFFGKSFVGACQEYLGPSETLTAIAEMKKLRNTFTEMDTNVERYMGNELTYLCDLCETLRERLASANIHPTQWHGPGAVASAVLRREGIKSHRLTVEGHEDFILDAEKAYYGGRFEQFQRGTIEGTIYRYDIRSAYPSAMATLPSLKGVRYIRHEPGDKIHQWGLYKIEHDSNQGVNRIGLMPWRSAKGGIYFPNFVNGWYWNAEIPAHIRPHIVAGWRPIGIDDSLKPFSWIADMYTQRSSAKSNGDPVQLALKLALNSLYGKTAQSKGAKKDSQNQWIKPTFHSIVWAGLITAITRAKLRDAMLASGINSLIAVETDSVFSTTSLSLNVSTKLGEWELETLQGLAYIQSGVSLTKSITGWEMKSRGFSPASNDKTNRDLTDAERLAKMVAKWQAFLAITPSDAKIPIIQSRFGSDPRRKEFASWYEIPLELAFDSAAQKRQHYGSCKVCVAEPRSYADCLHPLYVPNLPFMESYGYPFAWNEGEATPWQTMMEEFDPLFSVEMG